MPKQLLYQVIKCVWVMRIHISIVIGLVAICNAPIRAIAQKTEPEQSSAKEEITEDAGAIEEIVAVHDGLRQTHQGRVLVEATAGDVLLETDDGTLWLLDSDQILSRQTRDESFVPVTQEILAERLLADLPPGFRTHATPHYVVCYNTSRAYAQWTSSLLERLYKAFTNFWENQGFKVKEPEFPLAVLVFNDREAYDRASRDDLPAGVGNIVGFYSLRSNRVNMFDLTGVEALRGAGTHRGSMREINQMLSEPEAVPLVATIVHEATHQIAFNCGLQTRYADIPLWLCEGMAVYFEAPDLSSTRGWRGIGRVNYPRLTTFRENLSRWNAGALEELVADDRRFRDPRGAATAYANAWALNYYLIKYRPREYRNYLTLLAAKRPLAPDDSQKRLAEFREHFGELEDLERAFLKQMSRVR